MHRVIVLDRLAADQGYHAAQFNLGVLYANGDGVPQDLAQAAEWYRKAAEQGYSRAIDALQRLGQAGALQ